MRPTLRRFGGLILAAFLLCTLAGCVSQSDSDGMTTYTYAWWTAILGAGGAVFSAALGWFLIGSGPDMQLLGPISVRKTGYALLVGGPLLGVLLVPTVFTHYVKVDDQHFEVQQGWWALPVKYNVRFGDLKKIEFETEQHYRQRTPIASYYMVCVSQGDGRRRVELDALVREALDDVLTKAKMRGVRVPDPYHDDDD
jgi:hypothetical protein